MTSLVTAILMVTACRDPVRPNDDVASVDAARRTAYASSSSATTWLFVGESMPLTTQLTSTAKRNSRTRLAEITWRSRDSNIGSVTSGGMATGVSVGEVWMIASNTKSMDSVLVGVAASEPLAVSPSTVTDTVGALLLLSVNSSLPTLWQSSDTTIAVVGSAGEVALRRAGSVTILAQTNKGTAASAQITVVAGSGTADGGSQPVTGLMTSNLATLPQLRVSHSLPVSTRTIRVASGQSLQRAIDSARFGDEIVLANGAVFSESVRLRAKGSSSGWIVIRGEAQGAAAGTRATPALLSGVAKVQTTQNDIAAFEAEPGASGYWLTGFEVTAAPTVTSAYSLLMLDAQVTSSSLLPSRLVVDRMYVHGHAALQLRRCIMLGANNSMVVESWLSQCHAKGFDSQALLIVTAQGPILVRNNYLEGAGENLMIGGANPTVVGVTPADVEIVGNYFFKPLSWQADGWTVKNLLEVKFGQRIDIRNNYFENNWVSGQAGRGILLRASNQDSGAPWVRTNDITFRHNVLTNAASGLQLIADDAWAPYPTNRLAVLGNLVDRIGSESLGGTGSVLMLHGKLKDVEVRANTMMFSPQSAPQGTGVQLDGTGAENIEIASNIFDGGLYGLMLSGTTAGLPSLTAWAGTSFSFTGNAISAMAGRQLPSGNIALGEGQDLFGFRDFAARDYTPTDASVLRTLAPVPGAPLSLLGLAYRAR